ncbi:MAG: hypothetical protein R3F43_02230 [bacterium]
MPDDLDARFGHDGAVDDLLPSFACAPAVSARCWTRESPPIRVARPCAPPCWRTPGAASKPRTPPRGRSAAR